MTLDGIHAQRTICAGKGADRATSFRSGFLRQSRARCPEDSSFRSEISDEEDAGDRISYSPDGPSTMAVVHSHRRGVHHEPNGLPTSNRLCLPRPYCDSRDDAGRRAGEPDRAAWMKEARMGVMSHYLADWIAREDGRNQPLSSAGMERARQPFRRRWSGETARIGRRGLSCDHRRSKLRLLPRTQRDLRPAREEPAQ